MSFRNCFLISVFIFRCGAQDGCPTETWPKRPYSIVPPRVSATISGLGTIAERGEDQRVDECGDALEGAWVGGFSCW
jgi:hypothetical protein